ncbi:MAG: hypothetical protein ABI675_27570 [Chitinophagaceae bacterium]
MTVTKFISLSIFLFFTWTTTFGQGKEDKNYRLFNIRKVYQQINQYKNYTTVTIDDTEEFLGHGTDNGGSLTGYFKKDTLKKIIEWVGLSNKVIQNEYYLDNGKLIFVYSTESKYRFNESTQNFDYSKLDKAFTGLYYFSNEILIDTILSDKQHGDTKQETAAELLTSSKDYIKLLSERQK